MGDSSGDVVEDARAILRMIDGERWRPAKAPREPESVSDDAFRLSLRTTTLATFNEFGGPTGIAQLLRAAFENAPPGSAAQTSVLNMVLRGLEKYGEDDVDEDEVSMKALEKQLRREFLEDLFGKLTPETKAAVLKEVG
jgi:hypothetical protein